MSTVAIILLAIVVLWVLVFRYLSTSHGWDNEIARMCEKEKDSQ
jgi:TRAP-type C4-dicarboxylate transport system permease small subunit